MNNQYSVGKSEHHSEQISIHHTGFSFFLGDKGEENMCVMG